MHAPARNRLTFLAFVVLSRIVAGGGFLVAEQSVEFVRSVQSVQSVLSLFNPCGSRFVSPRLATTALIELPEHGYNGFNGSNGLSLAEAERVYRAEVLVRFPTVR
jgi:hypothetical protein